ncbi:hypothetical protein MNSC_08200 [Minisyncoccus archaeophilus]|uniref:hypothetical protein n=1 Tax=Minisyncoccus archaeiphilus TaxID=3238481 RepID=UPI00399C5DEF
METINDNLKIVYNEVLELHKYQQQSFDLLYNKLNWVLVSDVLLLIFFISQESVAILVIFCILISILFTLFAFNPKGYSYTIVISKQLENYEDEDYLKNLIKKRREAFGRNESKIVGIKKALLISNFFLSLGIILEFIIILIQYYD